MGPTRYPVYTDTSHRLPMNSGWTSAAVRPSCTQGPGGSINLSA